MKKKNALPLFALILFSVTLTGMGQYLLTNPVKHNTSIYATTDNENDAYADAETQQGTTQPMFPVNYGLHAEFQDEASETKKLVKQ
ncbi:hypothetical protein FMM05_15105 [Flavobacterium zepuense]|uniref:Uncharacterized protein n=1 Tax=Flavobacterium zepuense TaxID=2593302 RepID=A0A552UXT8_9FLAO|nr:hypothetical protein [Flavobacterium zepuense]TRW23022.1 hypothetical protein FMM05_15105 [Flavobacterium zepuense]